MAEETATQRNEGGTPSQAETSGKPKPRSRSRSAKTAPQSAPKTTRTMTDEHKNSLKVGREQGRIVGDYLDALEAHKPKRGRKVTRETLEERLRVLKEETIPNAKGKDRIQAHQDRIDLENVLNQSEDTDLIPHLQEAFVKVAKDYAKRKGFTAEAFREAGVPAAVLKEAGLTGARKSA